MQKIIERLYEGLLSNTLQTVGALIIFLLALPLIRSGLREKPPAPPPPPPVPIEVESAWLIQNVTRMQMDIDRIKDLMGVMSNQIAGVAQLIKRRQTRKPKK